LIEPYVKLDIEEIGDLREAAGLPRYEPKYLRNICPTCGEPMLGMHHHEAKVQKRGTMETDEEVSLGEDEYAALVTKKRDELEPEVYKWMNRLLSSLPRYFKTSTKYDPEQEDTGDTYGWTCSIMSLSNKAITIQVQVYESLMFDGSTEGINFCLKVEITDQAIEDKDEDRYITVIDWCLYNFTSEVWVDVRDDKAVRRRLKELFDCFTPNKVARCLRQCESDQIADGRKDFKI